MLVSVPHTDAVAVKVDTRNFNHYDHGARAAEAGGQLPRRDGYPAAGGYKNNTTIQEGQLANGEFLGDLAQRPLTLAAGGLDPVGLFLGQGANALEVAVVRAAAEPARGAVQEAWRARRGGRAAPVLLVVLVDGVAMVCGPVGDDPPVHPGLDAGQAERLCREALDQPDRHAALRFLAQALPSLETALPGINNEGLLALHELTHGVLARADWANAGEKAAGAVGAQGQDLLRGLGFRVERLDNLTHLLRGGDRRTALGVLLDQSESPESGAARFNNLSPITYALNKADAENLPWVVLIQGNRVRLYPTGMGVGVGRRGRAETYVECQPALLSDDHLAYLWLLFSADALAPEGSVSQILEGSRRFAGNLADRLRDRIYEQVVPALAKGIVAARNLANPTADDLDLTYQMALTVLFRLLFIAYAEDRDLLPYRFNEAYRRRSLKQKAQELADTVARDIPVAQGDNHWQEVAQLWRAVNLGNPEWAVPAYDGGLFTTDPTVSQSGAEIDAISLPNAVFEPALRGLLLIEIAEGGLGPVDFRSLGVREFGTVYEGLLESELSVADMDLSLDRNGNFIPVKNKLPVVVASGDVYLHDRSGARKSSGSYYTKSFAVEHLLDGALEPALADHFARLDALDEAEASDTLFDFRVADIAMGSGHFLVAAVDRIERAMTDYLGRRPLPGVRRELNDLREAALEHLGELADQEVIEDGSLLRRMIARRCIYGVDLNALSVQLARLAVWIHTFVPGLPLSVLDHNLVRGNSLVGVGTVDDIRKKFEEATGTLFAVDAESLLGQAAKPLNRLANIKDATLQDIAAAREAMREAREAIRSTAALCDLITAQPMSTDAKVVGFPFEDWERLADDLETLTAVSAARQDLAGLHALHFPIAFPEVFLRRRPGFDVILGNPPWEKTQVEEHEFWCRYMPGLRSVGQSERERLYRTLRRERPDLVAQLQAETEAQKFMRAALMNGQYPGMGAGHPDLYKAFCWRFWHLSASDGGRTGVVLPRSALVAKGSADFRIAIFGNAASVDVTMVLNRAGWVFDEAEHRYTIGLVAIQRGEPETENIRLRGPYASAPAFAEGVKRAPAVFSGTDVQTWNDTASLPLLPTERSIEIFAQLRKAPRVDLNDGTGWRARPLQGDLNSTTGKPLMDLASEECPRGFWPVFKGQSFDLWTPDTGTYYAWIDPKRVMPHLQRTRLRGGRNRRSPFSEFDPKWLRDAKTLPCLGPRIAFRRISRATDTRTIRTALVPPNVVLTDVAPYFLWPRSSTADLAYLLAVMSSLVLDWYARRFVETHMDFHVLDPFPVPRPPPDDPLRRRAIELAGRLACPDDRFAAWADEVGVECGPLAADEKDDMIHELDAVVAHLYGLSQPQLVHIFETFHEGWDYEDRLRAVLHHFEAWNGRV